MLSALSGPVMGQPVRATIWKSMRPSMARAASCTASTLVMPMSAVTLMWVRTAVTP